MKASSPFFSLVIDIESTLVKAILIDFQNPLNPQSVYSVESPILRKTHVSGDYLTKMMLRALEDVLQKTMKHGIPNSIHYVLSAPWSISESKTIQIKYEKETEIKESIVDNMVDKERAQFFEAFKKKNSLNGENAAESDLIFIEQKIFDIRLNGYSVSDYKGKRAKSLDVSFAFTLSSDKIIKRIRGTVSKTVHIKEEYFHSAVLTRYIASRQILSNDDDHILANVHGEFTDIVIVKKGLCSHILSFPFGSATLVRKMSRLAKTGIEASGSSLTMYDEGKYEETMKKKVENTILSIMKGWQSDFIKVLAEPEKDFKTPKKVYLSSLYKSIFKKVLEEKEFEVLDFDKLISEDETNVSARIYIMALRDMI